MRLLFPVVIILLSSCSLVAHKQSELSPKANFLEFDIEIIKTPNDTNKTWIRVLFHNISDTDIVMMKPFCIGKDMRPILVDANGIPMEFKFYEDRNCYGGVDTVASKSSYVGIFRYSVEQCFDMQSNKTYYLWFEYYGQIYLLNGKKIANDEPLISNKIKILNMPQNVSEAAH